MVSKKLRAAEHALAALRGDYPELYSRAIGAAEAGKTGFMDRTWQSGWDSSQYREEWVELPARAVSLARRFIARAGANAPALL